MFNYYRAIKQKKYTGKYSGAYLPQGVIEDVLLDLGKIYVSTKRELYRQAVKAILFLLEMSSRREALMTFKVISRDFKVRNRIIRSLYGEGTFVAVQTVEKGKRGEEFTWERFIRKSMEGLAIPQRNLTKTDIAKLSSLFRELLKKYLDKLNDITKLYIGRKRSLHLL